MDSADRGNGSSAAPEDGGPGDRDGESQQSCTGNNMNSSPVWYDGSCHHFLLSRSVMFFNLFRWIILSKEVYQKSST